MYNFDPVYKKYTFEINGGEKIVEITETTESEARYKVLYNYNTEDMELLSVQRLDD